MPYIEEVGDIEEQEWAEAGAILLGERGGPTLYARHTLYWEFPRVSDSQWAQYGFACSAIRSHHVRLPRRVAKKFSRAKAEARTRRL